MVQLGAFTRRSSAFALSQRARGKGYTSFVQEIAKDDSRKLFHVRIGPQPNRQAAESLRRRVEQDLRLSAIVTRSP
jgi:DedD protein